MNRISIDEYKKIVKKKKYKPIVTNEEMEILCKKYGLQCTPEYRFHNKRKWRADFMIYKPTDLDIKEVCCLIELEGWGRHQRYLGFENDCIKYAEAFLLGYNVVRLTRKAVQAGYLDKVLNKIKEG